MNKKHLTLVISGIMALNMMSIPTGFADDKAAFLETFEKYFDVYKCTATYMVDNTEYLYLLEDANAVHFVTAPENSDFIGVDELPQEDWYYTIKEGMLDAYIEDYCEKEQQIYQKPFKTNLVFVDENGNTTDVINVANREEANEIIKERDAKEGSYEIKEYFAGGGFCYYIDPQFEDEQLIQYIDKDGNVLEEYKLDSKKFTYKSVSDCAYKRIVSKEQSKEFVENADVAQQSSYYNLGDINFDDVIDLTDLTELSLAIIGDKTLEGASLMAADIDKNGELNIADLALFKQYIMNEDQT